MATILYAWELGADYGHINSFLPLAERLRARGHKVVLAVKDLSHIAALSGTGAFDLVQAPVWLPQIVGLPEPMVCYSDMLLRSGYLDRNSLLGLVKAWRSLLTLIKPQLLIADHAPTALLATHGLDVSRVLYGSGFFSPPRTTPLPSMRPWLQVPPQRFVKSESIALRSINQVLTELGVNGLDNLAQLFAVDEDYIMSPAEFDHYPNRVSSRYMGALPSAQGGAAPDWPAVAGPKLFLYVKPQHKSVERLLVQLRTSSFCVLVHAPGLSLARRRALQSDNLHFSPQPADMQRVCQEAAAIVCHAGLGTVLKTLLAGLPVFMLPMHLEQALNSRNAVRLGAGLAIEEPDDNTDFLAPLRELVGNPDYAARARDFASKYTTNNREAVLNSIAEGCEALLKGRIDSSLRE